MSFSIFVLSQFKELKKHRDDTCMCDQQTVQTIKRMVKTHENHVQQGRHVAIPFKKFICVVDPVDTKCIQADQHRCDKFCCDWVNYDRLSPQS